MKQAVKLNGHMIYNAFLSGYYSIMKRKKYLNSINLFPVPDGDTGTNMVRTFFYALQIESVDFAAGKTLSCIADKALSGARGNSGIIISQFINSLSEYCAGVITINTADFSEALTKAAEKTYSSVNNPEEGTILTIIRVWTEKMYTLSRKHHDFRDLILKSENAVLNALEKTREQLPVLKKANVVDAGASGFVSFLEGISEMVKTGIIPDREKVLTDNSEIILPDSPAHREILSKDINDYRYCSEALIIEINYPENKISSLLKNHGNSLIVSGSSRKLKIHIHTNNPVSLFRDISKCGTIIESKVDDMIMQQNILQNRISDIAVVTDSIADIPQNIVDSLQIHIISLNILMNDNIFLDRLNIDSRKMYSEMNKSGIHLSTSLPDPVKVKEKLLSLLSVYKSVVVLTVSSKLSGTWNVINRCAGELKSKDYKISIIDSRLNSAAQGLVAFKAAEDAAEKLPHEIIVNNAEKRIRKSSIYVAVPTLKYMVRGGRVTPLTGLAAALLNLKPVVSLDQDGKSIKSGAAFTKRAALKKIMNIVSSYKDEIDIYNVVHAGAEEEAELFAEKLFNATGKRAYYIMEVSSTIGIHTGKGVLAAGILLK